MSDCRDNYRNFLIDQTPVYAPEHLKDINPFGGSWMGRVKTAVWPNGKTNTITFDRMHKVFPNTVREWTPKEYAECTNPCDVEAVTICTGGYSRDTVYKEVQEHKTDVICFDQIRDVTDAEAHWDFIVSDVLAPTTDLVTSSYMRKRSASNAGHQMIANSALTPFTWNWVVVANNEVFIDTNADPATVFKMAPQMLQRRVMPLIREGYFNQRVIESPGRTFEFISDADSIQELINQTNTSATVNQSLVNQWAYTDLRQVKDFWKYGWEGMVGDWALMTDPMQLRFNYVGATGVAPLIYRYQVVLPYTNVAADVGNRIQVNTDYDDAQYAFSFGHNRAAFTMFGATAQSIHPQMPFVIPDLAGQWRFATRDIGCENYKQNKGLFFARWEFGWRSDHPEWEDLWFHRREPPCIPEIEACNEDPGYPTQAYGCEEEPCDQGPFAPAEECEEGEGVQVTAVTIGGIPIALEAATKACAADHAALAALLNADDYASLLGTWDTNADDLLILTEATQQGVDVTIECCSLQ